MKLQFIVPGAPVPKQRARQGAHGNWYTPAASRTYEQAIAAHGMVTRIRERWVKADPTSTFVVEVEAVVPDQRTRDVDNIGKSCLDGLNKVLWRDDRQVTRLVVNRRVDRERPHTRITVTRIEQLPLGGTA